MILIEEEPLVVEEWWFDEPDGEIEERSKYFPETEDQWEWNSIKSWNRESIKIWNQNSQPTTYKACGIYSATIISNGQNYNEYMTANVPFTQEDPLSVWKKFQNIRWRPNRGTSLQEVAKSMKRQGYWNNVLECKTEAEMKNGITNWCFIHTWSNKIDRKKSSKWTAVFCKSGVAHLIAIVGFDAKWFIAANSFWSNWWDDGYFHIPYWNKNKLYTCLAVLDADSSKMIENVKFEKEVQEAISLWLFNGNDRKDPATREQIAAQLVRLYHKILDSIKK